MGRKHLANVNGKFCITSKKMKPHSYASRRKFFIEINVLEENKFISFFSLHYFILGGFGGGYGRNFGFGRGYGGYGFGR